MVRLKLRTVLVAVAALGLLCWAATRLAIWYVRRPTYKALAEYHRTEAHGLEYQIAREAYLQRCASDLLPVFLAHPELDVQRNTTGDLRSDTFHPFSGPRSEWAAAVAAHGAIVDRLSEKAAYHSRLCQEYQRAYSSFFSAVPSRGVRDPVPWWSAPGGIVPRVPWWAR